MKKILFIFAFIFAGSIAFSQNSLTVKMKDKNVSLGTVTANYTDGTSEDFEVGAKGKYQFELSGKEIAAVIINGVTIRDGETATIIIDGNSVQASLSKSVHDESKGPFSNIVVR